ncbi:streptomycin 6-kinase [Devosia sp. YR412]|uniref:aminoglycoside phosphotransferase family protein n=1 Tax=Devosia sp. YR412 TaxID=1881030 RepID=UPI0008CFBE33|nr:aminoglycoside phosphotransferase family protein [Devosia sp. YR412]SEQ11669.1 streptomycin 6-kinase [Devosia sp. YR412]
MSEGRFAVPEAVRRRAQSEGPRGDLWLADLDQTLTSLEQDWDLTIGEAMDGGTTAYVSEASDSTGDVLVIKVATPDSAIGRHEADMLQRAGGKGYARLLKHDPIRNAMLLEKLGPRLDTLELPYSQQVDIMCATLLEAWMPVPFEHDYPTGADKANSLATDILAMWQRGGQPCSAEVIETALRYCKERAALYRPEATVLAHGDPHPANTLVIAGTDPVRFKFVDPDGLAIDPAYDLGVLLRAWNEGLEGKNAHNIARARVRLLTQYTQVPAEPIWQWAYIERVSTGLLMLEIGNAEGGREFLRVSEALLVL